jgi:23S rRNA (cytosine1962-C5)-methyltransferase
VPSSADSHPRVSTPRPAYPVYPALRLKPGRDYTLRQGHPWLFSGAFDRLPGGLAPGAVVEVIAHDGQWLARGHLNAANSLAFRLLTRDRAEVVDAAFFARRLREAQVVRALLPSDVTAYRLANAEADGLPGLIVDRYDRWLVAQISSAGMEAQRAELIAALCEALGSGGVEGIVIRDDVRARAREGLVVGAASVAWGDVPDDVEIAEHGVRFAVAPLTGQKTGFFLDQRDKRARVRDLAPHGASLLNLFAYSGGFALAALAANPTLRTVNVDSSGPALAQARRNYTLNGHEASDPRHEFIEEDVGRYLTHAGAAGEGFDLVVVDPPAFAKSLSQRDRALRAYEALNSRALQVTAPGGLLLTCSCSGGVNAEEFETAVRQALAREGRAARIIESFGPSIDHPTLLGFSEDRYLKALLLRID